MTCVPLAPRQCEAGQSLPRTLAARQWRPTTYPMPRVVAAASVHPTVSECDAPSAADDTRAPGTARQTVTRGQPALPRAPSPSGLGFTSRLLAGLAWASTMPFDQTRLLINAYVAISFFPLTVMLPLPLSSYLSLRCS